MNVWVRFFLFYFKELNVNLNVSVKAVVTLEISCNAGIFLKSGVIAFQEEPFGLKRVN